MEMGDARPVSPEASVDRELRERMVLGLLAAPGVAHDLAEQLAEQLPGLLRERFPDVEWEATVAVEALAGSPAGIGTDLAKLARQRMLRKGWQLAIVLTDFLCASAAGLSPHRQACRLASAYCRFPHWARSHWRTGLAQP